MMEQRVHGVMAAHRVHAFSALPEDVRHGLRSEIDRTPMSVTTHAWKIKVFREKR
jgi:hypothetical protein